MSPLTLILWIVAIILGTVILWYGTGMLEGSSERLSTYYGLPEIVQGTMIVAIGSSFPELTTVVLSTWLHGDFGLGVSAIVGSAIFNILVIPAAAGIYTRKPLDFNRQLIYKEAQFYIISIALLLLTFSFGVIFDPALNPASNDILGRVDRSLSLLPLGLYLMYVFLQYQDAREFDTVEEVNDINPVVEWGKLLAGLVVILVGVEVLLRAAITFGEYFNTPSFLWGITIVAASTSLPDTMASIRLASGGNSITSIANVLGSNVFDLLVCVPAGILVAGTTTVNFSLAVPLFAALTIGTFFLFALMRTNMVLTVVECWILLVLYAIFVIWIVLETFSLINIFGGIP